MASVEARHLLLQMILKITVLKQNLNSRGGQGEKNVIFCYYFHHFFFHFIATIVTFAWKWRSNFILSSIYCRTAFCPLPWSFCWSLIIQKSLVKIFPSSSANPTERGNTYWIKIQRQISNCLVIISLNLFLDSVQNNGE